MPNLRKYPTTDIVMIFIMGLLTMGVIGLFVFDLFTIGVKWSSLMCLLLGGIMTFITIAGGIYVVNQNK